jgi:hypothetical protein
MAGERGEPVRGRDLPVGQARQNFQVSLARALEGLTPASHTGLGPEVEEALITIAWGYPTAGGELVEEARQRFGRELARREHDNE